MNSHRPTVHPELADWKPTYKPEPVASNDARIDKIIDFLRGKGWVKRAAIAAHLGVADRTMRKIKEASEGLIISRSTSKKEKDKPVEQAGYKLITEATLQEMDHAENEWFKRKEAAERAIANIRRLRHKRQFPEALKEKAA